MTAWFVLCLRFGSPFVGEALNLPDSSYTSSSQLDVPWSAPNMKLPDGYNGWIAKGNDLTPWIEVDLLQIYTILGLYLKKGDGNLNHITKFSLKFSVDSSTYTYIGHDLVPVYLPNEVSTYYWFDNAEEGRYWRIETYYSALGEFVGNPYIRGDFLGVV